jgi:hypothetical protein
VAGRWNEYGIRGAGTSDAWSGQGRLAFERLLASAPFEPGTVDAKALRANGIPALEEKEQR